MSKKTEIKKLEKIEKYQLQLGGLRQRYFKSEKYLFENLWKLSLQRIIKRKIIMKKREKRIRKLCKRLLKLGVLIDLEQR
ncbi:hypothetical protein ACNSOO_04510 [Aliarcobacter lanthieri]|uniref:hypothetical protein n=1 Tax=Aliarcobacter lanthieri TaxID=1355374 RepID=UPI003AAE541F